MLSVTITPDGDKGLKDIHESSILYMTKDRRVDRVILYTIEGIFYLPGPLKVWQNALNKMGNKFIRVDRATVINAENVVLVDPIYKEAYFEMNITKGSVKCEIAHHRYREFMEELLVMNPRVVLT